MVPRRLIVLLVVLQRLEAVYLRSRHGFGNEDLVCEFVASSEKLQGEKKIATTRNVLFQWRNVVVAEENGSRYLLFIHDTDMRKCSEQALVDCQGKPQSLDTDQNPLVGSGLDETSSLVETKVISTSNSNSDGPGNHTDDGTVIDKCSAMPCNTGPSVALSYARSMLAAAWSYSPRASSVAVLGVGGGMMPSWIQSMRPDVQRLDAVDINLGVLRATSCFGLRAGDRTRLVEEDGRKFLSSQLDRTYDVMLLDVFTQRDVIPGCLSTQEFFTDVQRVLTDDGVLVVNVLASDFDTVLPTIQAVFHNVLLGRAMPEANYILVASTRNLSDVTLEHHDDLYDWWASAEFAPAPHPEDGMTPRNDAQCCGDSRDCSNKFWAVRQ